RFSLWSPPPVGATRSSSSVRWSGRAAGPICVSPRASAARTSTSTSARRSLRASSSCELSGLGVEHELLARRLRLRRGDAAGAEQADQRDQRDDAERG